MNHEAMTDLMEQRQQACDVAAFRPIQDAINRTSAIDFTPALVSQICAVLSNRISGASWSHFPEAVSAMEKLDDASDELSAS